MEVRNFHLKSYTHLVRVLGKWVLSRRVSSAFLQSCMASLVVLLFTSGLLKFQYVMTAAVLAGSDSD